MRHTRNMRTNLCELRNYANRHQTVPLLASVSISLRTRDTRDGDLFRAKKNPDTKHGGGGFTNERSKRSGRTEHVHSAFPSTAVQEAFTEPYVRFCKRALLVKRKSAQMHHKAKKIAKRPLRPLALSPDRSVRSIRANRANRANPSGSAQLDECVFFLAAAASVLVLSPS